ncbi:hypothetical protein [Streptomyces zhihengii]
MGTEIEFRVIDALGSAFTIYGFVGLFTGRLDRWAAYGLLAAGCFFNGLMSTVEESWAYAALYAGMAAHFGNGWWHGGGNRQADALLRAMRDGSAR